MILWTNIANKVELQKPAKTSFDVFIQCMISVNICTFVNIDGSLLVFHSNLYDRFMFAFLLFVEIYSFVRKTMVFSQERWSVSSRYMMCLLMVTRTVWFVFLYEIKSVEGRMLAKSRNSSWIDEVESAFSIK